MRSIPFASLMNCSTFRFSYGVVNKHKRKGFENLLDENIGGLIFVLIPGVRAPFAVISTKFVESFNHLPMRQHPAAYVDRVHNWTSQAACRLIGLVWSSIRVSVPYDKSRKILVSDFEFHVGLEIILKSTNEVGADRRELVYGEKHKEERRERAHCVCEGSCSMPRRASCETWQTPSLCQAQSESLAWNKNIC